MGSTSPRTWFSHAQLHAQRGECAWGDNIMLAMLSFSIPMGAHKFGSFASTFRVLQETILKGGSEITNASR